MFLTETSFSAGWYLDSDVNIWFLLSEQRTLGQHHARSLLEKKLHVDKSSLSTLTESKLRREMKLHQFHANKAGVIFRRGISPCSVFDNPIWDLICESEQTDRLAVNAGLCQNQLVERQEANQRTVARQRS